MRNSFVSLLLSVNHKWYLYHPSITIPQSQGLMKIKWRTVLCQHSDEKSPQFNQRLWPGKLYYKSILSEVNITSF